MIRQEVAAACFRSRPRRPPQPKRFSVGPSRGLPPSIRPRRSPRTCPTTPTTPADFRAPPNARPSNPHSPSPLAVAISAARGFLPRRLSDAGPSALASASVPGRRPKPLTTPAVSFAMYQIDRVAVPLEQRLRVSKLENSQRSGGGLESTRRRQGPHACEPASLLGRRTARNDAAACQDEPIAAPFLNSQDAPRPRDKISGRYLLRTIATVNHRDAVPCILDAIVSEQGPRVVGSGYFVRGGRVHPCHKRRLFRRGRREGIGRTCARDGGSLLQLVEPCRETSNF